MKKLLWIVFVGLVFSSCNRESNLITNTGFAFGRTYTIKYYALDAETDFKDEIELLLNEINKSISVYLPTSDVSRINDGDNSIVVDEHFKNVFLKSYEVWTLTNGEFDPTVGGLVNAWGLVQNSLLIIFLKRTLIVFYNLLVLIRSPLLRKDVLLKRIPK